MRHIGVRPSQFYTNWRETTGLVSPRRRHVVRLKLHSTIPLLAKLCTRDRSHLRSSIASLVQFPLRKLPFSMPRGAPGLNPPCKRHRRRSRIAGHWHAVPARVRAPQRGARLRFSSRFPTSWFMGLSAKILCPYYCGLRRLRHFGLWHILHDLLGRRRNAGMLRSSSFLW